MNVNTVRTLKALRNSFSRSNKLGHAAVIDAALKLNKLGRSLAAESVLRKAGIEWTSAGQRFGSTWQDKSVFTSAHHYGKRSELNTEYM